MSSSKSPRGMRSNTMQAGCCFGFVLAIVLAFAASTLAQSPREKLQGLTIQLQQAPNDDALREHIIKLAAGITPAPAVPPEAERFEDRARYVFENAKSVAELLNAASEYAKATNAAPWIAGYYFDTCIILEKANKLVPAIRNCKWYLVAAPDATDAREVRRRIAGLEYALERRREGHSHRKSSKDICTDLERHETGAKVASIGARKLSVKLITAMYGGTPRNQVMISIITGTSVGKIKRLNLDPIYETGFDLDGTLYDLSIDRDGKITVWHNRRAVIITSIDELTQLRNDQLNTSRLLTQGDKTFVRLCQGGPVQGNDDARVAGWLLFASDCSGQPLGPKPGWLPTTFIDLFDLSTGRGGFEEPGPDHCDRW